MKPLKKLIAEMKGESVDDDLDYEETVEDASSELESFLITAAKKLTKPIASKFSKTPKKVLSDVIDVLIDDLDVYVE